MSWKARRMPAMLGLAALAACGETVSLPRAQLSLVETLGGADTVGYARALEARPFSFPEDHGPHPDFRSEWWYVTGNFTSTEGREVGVQFTIFRSAMAPEAPGGTSAWSTNQGYMAHFAVTDVDGARFHAFERFGRESLRLAGAQAAPFRVWLEDWELVGSDAMSTFPMVLRASQDGVAVDLVLDSAKVPVLQGEAGLSQKGPEPGNASYYYSFTRMPTRGTVVLGADTLQVDGLAWLDREWSTSALSAGQVGWDWFALQLEGGWELMVYALRQEDGTAHPLSDGVLVDPDGNPRRLEWGRDVLLDATGEWTSPMDGATYPSGWRVRVPQGGWDLTVTPVLDDQELDLAFRYWEGAVSVSGTQEGTPVTGRGYVELTGYAGTRPER